MPAALASWIAHHPWLRRKLLRPRGRQLRESATPGGKDFDFFVVCSERIVGDRSPFSLIFVVVSWEGIVIGWKSCRRMLFGGGKGLEFGRYHRVSHCRNAQNIKDGGWLKKNSIG